MATNGNSSNHYKLLYFDNIINKKVEIKNKEIILILRSLKWFLIAKMKKKKLKKMWTYL